MDDVDELRHRHGFARERRLLDLEAGVLDQAAVGRHGVARFKQHDVADDQFLAAHGDDLAVAQHARGRRGHLLQRLDRLLRLVLLVDAEDGVDDDDRQDDDHVRKALALDDREHTGDRCRNEQDEDHGILHLLEEADDQRRFLRLGKFVGPIFPEPVSSLLSRKALLAALRLAQDVFCRFQIVFQHTSTFLS